MLGLQVAAGAGARAGMARPWPQLPRRQVSSCRVIVHMHSRVAPVQDVELARVSADVRRCHSTPDFRFTIYDLLRG